MVRTTDDGATDINTDWVPPIVDDKQRAWIAARAVPDLDAYLAPAEGGELTARITVLLSHYFVARMPAAAWSLMIEDWRKALADLPMWAVNAGCGLWFQTEERKPTPAGIRRLAKDAMAEAEEERAKLLRMVALPSPANRLSAALHGKLPAVMVSKWINPMAVELVDGGAIVRCPNSHHRDWVESRYSSEIKTSLAVKRVWFLLPGQDVPQARDMGALGAKPMPGTTVGADGRTSAREPAADPAAMTDREFTAARQRLMRESAQVVNG